MIAGRSRGDLAAELFAELALQHLDDVVLAAQLRRLVCDLRSQLRGVRVARRDGVRGLLVVGGRRASP